MSQPFARPTLLKITAVCITLFGLLTLLSGGLALFGPEDVRARFGDTVSFVLIFNFFAGFAYIAIGICFWQRSGWTFWASAVVLGATAITLTAFLLHLGLGGAYEIRTLIALPFRTLVLALVTWIAYRHLANRNSLNGTNRSRPTR